MAAPTAPPPPPPPPSDDDGFLDIAHADHAHAGGAS
jgi:hypothetical protein